MMCAPPESVGPVRSQRVSLTRWSSGFASADDEYRWHLARATAQRDENGNDHPLVRHEYRNRGLQARRGGAEPADGGSDGSESREERLPRRDESRAAHAAQRDRRLRAADRDGRARADHRGAADRPLKIQRSKNHLDGLVTRRAELREARRRAHRVRVGDVLRKTVDAVVEMVAPQVAEKQLRVERSRGAAEACRVSATRTRCGRFCSTCSPTRSSSRRAGGTLSLALTSTERTCAIAVSDTGIGIPPEQIERSSSRSCRRSAPTPSDQGVGLGLAISRQLARAMGGELVREEHGRRGVDIHADASEGELRLVNFNWCTSVHRTLYLEWHTAHGEQWTPLNHDEGDLSARSQ